MLADGKKRVLEIAVRKGHQGRQGQQGQENTGPGASLSVFEVLAVLVVLCVLVSEAPGLSMIFSQAMRRPLTLLLLLAIALGMMAGPHPCHAQPAPQTVTTGHASCHASQGAKAPSKPAHDCCDPQKGGHVLCDQACQGAAVMAVAPTLPEALAFREPELPVAQRSGALFVFAIDHVPLA